MSRDLRLLSINKANRFMRLRHSFSDEESRTQVLEWVRSFFEYIKSRVNVEIYEAIFYKKELNSFEFIDSMIHDFDSVIEKGVIDFDDLKKIFVFVYCFLLKNFSYEISKEIFLDESEESGLISALKDVDSVFRGFLSDASNVSLFISTSLTPEQREMISSYRLSVYMNFSDLQRSSILYGAYSKTEHYLSDLNKKTQKNEDDQIELRVKYDKEKEILDELSRYVKELTTKFNFIGISKGFQDALAEKEKERKGLSFWRFVTGFAMVSFPFVPLFFNIGYDFDYKSFPFFATVQFILIYFFRINHKDLSNVKSQILQLRLRVSVCQFLHTYLKDKKEKFTAETDKETVERFEALIFSNIMPNSESVPSTFDGLEQLAKLINSIKNK